MIPRKNTTAVYIWFRARHRMPRCPTHPGCRVALPDRADWWSRRRSPDRNTGRRGRRRRLCTPIAPGCQRELPILPRPRLDRHTCLDRRSRHPMDGAAARSPDMRSDHLQRLVHLPAHGYQEASRQTSFVPRGHLVMQRATRRVGYLLTGATARAPRRFPQERRP